MKNRTGQEGNTLVIVLVLLVVGAIGYYFYSDVFKTKVDETARQVREWTPENIQKDPVGYLTWARTECNKSREQLLARQLSVKTRINEATRTIGGNEAEGVQYDGFLVEAKDLYRSAAENNEWPVSLRGATLSEEQLKRRIVEAFQKIERDSAITVAYKGALVKYENQSAEIQVKLDELLQLKNKLTTDLELAKIKQSFDGIEGIADRLNAMMDTSNALSTDGADEPSLADLVKPSPEAQVNGAFAAIMAK